MRNQDKAPSPHNHVVYELPADFVQNLRADRDALAACNSDKHSAIPDDELSRNAEELDREWREQAKED